MVTDRKILEGNDLGVVTVGVLVLALSFFPYYGASGTFLGQHATASWDAWHYGVNVVALLLLQASPVIVLLEVLVASTATMTGALKSLVAVLCGVGATIVVIRSFTLEHGSVAGFDYGLRWGAYLLMAASVAQAVFALMRLRETPGLVRGESSAPVP